MHTVLEDYKKAKRLGVSLDSFIALNPEHQLALAMKKLILSLQKKIPFEESIRQANQINYKEYEVEEQLLFLKLLFQNLIQSKGIKSALPILVAVKRLVTPNLDVDWQAIPLSLEGELYFQEGNFKKQLATLEKELDLLKINSCRYVFQYWTYLILLAFLNEYEKFDFHIKQFNLLPKEINLPISIDYVYLIVNEERGNFKDNVVLLSNIKANKPMQSIQKVIDQYDSFLQIILHHQLPELDEQDTDNWTLFSLYYLFANEPVKSLEWANKLAEHRPDYNLLPNFISFYLIRAELANKNINSAEYLLESRKRTGNTSIFDDFFWFRLFHSKGDSKKAQEYFNLFSATVDKYDLNNRFDLELQLSPEILPKDIRYYMRNLAQEKSKETFSPDPINKINEDQSMGFIIGESKSIKQIKDLILKFSNVDTSVLITGETGTGKELIAKALWLAGSFQNKPYIPINCGAISDHLLQSELFGHKKGAFTGAYQDHKGVFEQAQDGIVFLDEISEISHAMQINLLRVLEAREYRPVGSNENKKLNCKIITATNRKLSDLVNAGHFRSDLQFRLERLNIELPPLRERKEDIPLLIHHFLNEEYPNLDPLQFDETTLNHLKSLYWPGNIRELRNEMGRVRLFFSDQKLLTMNELSNKYKDNKENTSLTELTTSQPKPLEILTQESATKNNSRLNSKFRRLEELKKLFVKHTKLSRAEVEEYLNVSTNTAFSYLNILEQEKYICKKTFANSDTHYYEIIR